MNIFIIMIFFGGFLIGLGLGLYIGHYIGYNFSMSKIKNKNIEADKWQTCPKCNGDGDLLMYASQTTIETNARPICDVCKGKKIIDVIMGLPPQFLQDYESKKHK